MRLDLTKLQPKNGLKISYFRQKIRLPIFEQKKISILVDKLRNDVRI